MPKSYTVKIDPTKPAVLRFGIGGATHDYWERDYTPAGGKTNIDNGAGQDIPDMTLPAAGLDGGMFTLKLKILPATGGSYPWRAGIRVFQDGAEVQGSPFVDGNPNASGPDIGWIDLKFGS